MAWPTLSYGQVRSGVPTPAQIPLDVAAAAGGGLARGVGEAAGLAAQWARREMEAQNTIAVSDAITRATGALDEYRTELDSDTDFAGREAKFAKRAKEIYDRELGTLGNGLAKQDFHVKYNRVQGSISLQVRHDRRDAQMQDARLGLQENIDALLNKALFARSPGESAAYLDQVNGMVRDAVRTGIVPALMGRTLVKQSSIKLQAGQASELIRTNPAAAIAMLRDPAQFTALDATTRQSLIVQATQRGESLGAQARAEARAAIGDYRAARAAGQPVSPEETERVRRQAAGAGLGKQFDGMARFYDRVDEHTVGKTLPQLRDSVRTLEGGGTIEDLAVARAVRQQLTREQREEAREYDRQFKEFEAYRARGEVYPQLPQLLQRAEDLGGQPGRERIESRDAYWSRVNRAAQEPASAVATRIDMIERDRRAAQGGQLTVEDLEERDALRLALQQKAKLAGEDPAAYARRFYPTIDETLRAAEAGGDADGARRARAALIDAQRREGIPEHRITLLTKPEAEAIEARLNAKESAVRLAEVDRLRALYKDPAEWQMVRRQLDAGQKLPPDVEVLATLPAYAERDRQMLAAAFQLDRNEAEKNLGKENVKIITGRVDSLGDDVQRLYRGQAGGAEYFATLKTAAERLALYYATVHGMDTSRASKTAWDDVFYRHWDISTGVRLPKVNGTPVVDPAIIAERQRLFLRDIERLPIDPDSTGPGTEGVSEKRRRAMTVENARRNGFWVTMPDDRGAVFFTSPGIPLTMNGSPLYMPFAPGGDRDIFEEIEPRGRSEAQRQRAEDARRRNMGGPAPDRPRPELLPGGRR